MLNSLPDTDIIALHVFIYFMNIDSKLQFFTTSECNTNNTTLKACLSIDSDGHIHENAANKGEITFSFSFVMHQEAMMLELKKDQQSLLYFKQILPQIYAQVLVLNKRQLLLKDKCLEIVTNLFKEREAETTLIYEHIMMPIIARSPNTTIH